ncbi:hypothetical protein [Streptomyces liangshanensis]|uniref:hypothetical protein n=1 Tax=Streptomyces liangshanensis TaxID=2717324 RepID=UPI001AAF4459|nr:hypothetical protein [Streptomyces liangshanensis]
MGDARMDQGQGQDPERGQDGTENEAQGEALLPASPAEPDLAPVSPPDAGEPNPARTVDTLAAALRRDAADLEIYGQVLSGSLAVALPPGSITLDRRRTLSDRLAGREGRVERVEIALEDQRLTLTLTHGHPVAEVAKMVRGVVLSRTPVGLDEWTRRLAAAMAARSRSDAEARAALERLILEG